MQLQIHLRITVYNYGYHCGYIRVLTLGIEEAMPRHLGIRNPCQLRIRLDWVILYHYMNRETLFQNNLEVLFIIVNILISVPHTEHHNTSIEQEMKSE